MPKSFAISVLFIFIALASSPSARSQGAPAAKPAAQNGQQAPSSAPALLDGWGRPVKAASKPGPAPRHDISGIWEPARGPGDGIMAWGPRDMPYDGAPEHNPPYTPLGLATQHSHKPLEGEERVLESLSNDPRNKCDPLGFPRADFYQVRHTQILQNEQQVVVLYEFEKRWRVIWTDGRDFPRNPAPRWFGYSIGKWEDDYTFVVQTCCINDEVWVDRAGRPHSPDMRVEERFHRLDANTLELTVTINDPQMYTKPWVALNKLPFKLQSWHFDVTEMLCSPAELAEYNRFIGGPASTK